MTEMSKYAEIEVSYESANPNIASVRMNGVLTVNGQDTYHFNCRRIKNLCRYKYMELISH